MENSKSKRSVKFKVLQIIDKRNWNSSLEEGNVYFGKKDFNREDIVWWTDPQNGQEWVFYVGDTCEILEENCTDK